MLPIKAVPQSEKQQENNMKPFNLEAALAGAPVCTRGGEPVTQLTPFTVTSDHPLVGVIEGEFYRWTLDGRFPSYSPRDLFMAPVKKTGWIARSKYQMVHETEDLAKRANPEALGYHEISWEE